MIAVAALRAVECDELAKPGTIARGSEVTFRQACLHPVQAGHDDGTVNSERETRIDGCRKHLFKVYYARAAARAYAICRLAHGGPDIDSLSHLVQTSQH
jgi:hypothetical protein